MPIIPPGQRSDIKSMARKRTYLFLNLKGLIQKRAGGLKLLQTIFIHRIRQMLFAGRWETSASSLF